MGEGTLRYPPAVFMADSYTTGGRMNEFTGSFVTFDNGWFATRGVNEAQWRLSRMKTHVEGPTVSLILTFKGYMTHLWEVRHYIESNSE